MRQRTIMAMLALAALALSGCGKENNCTVSFGATNFSINPNAAGDFAGLNHVGGYAYATGGHRGVVIVRTAYNEFVAYERTCPEDNSSRVSVSAEWGSSILECPTCHSLFIVESYGMPADGSATTCPLFQYNTSYTDGLLYVY